MPASAAFLEAWRRGGRTPVSLVSILLTDPTALTLNLASRECSVDGVYWQEMISGLDGITARCRFPTPQMEPVSASFDLVANRRLAIQPEGQKLAQIFSSYRWVGARVMIKLWETSLAEPSFQVFAGIVQSYRIAKESITVSCIQRTDWNIELPEEVVGPDNYPRSPESARGKFPPICYGSLKGIGLHARPDGPWTKEYGSLAEGPNGLQMIGGGKRAVPGVVVDTGRGGVGGTPSRILFASHPVKSFGDDRNGTALWLEQGGRLCRVQPGIQVAKCRAAITVSAVTRGDAGSFITEGVRVGALIANDLANHFPTNTRITTVAAATLGTDKPCSLSATVNTVGEFLDLVNDEKGPALLIPDAPAGANSVMTTLIVPIWASNVEVITVNGADNPRAVLDPFTDTNYAVLDASLGQLEVRARLSSFSVEGDLTATGIDVLAGLHHISGVWDDGVDGNVHVTLRHDSGPESGGFLALPNPNPGYTGNNISGTPPRWSDGSGVPPTPWAFGECVIRCFINNVSGLRVHVYALGLAVRVRPTAQVVEHRRMTAPARVEYKERKKNWIGYDSDIRFRPFYADMPDQLVPMFGAAQEGWAANLEGWADTGGAYTGIGTDLIERGPDIVHHLLVKYGKQTSAIVNLGAGFGSFVAARAQLRTWRLNDMKHSLAITEPTTIQEVIESIAADSVTLYYLDRFTDKFFCVPWRSGAENYGRKIPREWLDEDAIVIDHSPASDIVSGVRMPYSFDYVSRAPLHEITQSVSHSSSGWRYRKIRDQQMTVIAGVNDKLDFRVAGVPYAATLTPGDYSPATLVAHIPGAMAAQYVSGTHGSTWLCGYGPRVIAGVNDTIPLFDGSGYSGVTIAPGDYATMEALATAITTAIAPVSWSCSYSRATRQFTFTRSSGTWQIGFASTAPTQKRAVALVGSDLFNHNGTFTCLYHREEQRIYIGNSIEAFDLRWETGANGLNAAVLSNCAGLVGFDTTRDIGGQPSYVGHSPKGDREQKLRAVRDRYGGKPDIVIPGTTVWDDDTARQSVTELVPLVSEPRVRIRFTSSFLPDLERGRIIEFEQSVDAVQSFPGFGDSSWVGKRFIVTETRQRLGPDSFATDVVAVQI